MTNRLIISADESDKKGRHFSNFYGGALINASDRQEISDLLNEKKAELNLGNELKWERISTNYVEKYIAFLDDYFDLISDDAIKIRIMFTQNLRRPKGLTDEQIENQYFLLYYQFFKHAFGLQYCGLQEDQPVSVALLLDEVPHNKTKLKRFRKYIASLYAYPPFQIRGVRFPPEDIAEIDSKQHVIAQGLDIILGGVCSRLNDKHTKPTVKGRHRSKKARAKELVYRHMQERIRQFYPYFNAGVSTGTKNGLSDRWEHRYRHWLFVPSDHEVDPNYRPKNK